MAKLQGDRVKSDTPYRRSEAATSNIAPIRNRKSYWTLAFSLSVLPLLARAERAYRNMPWLPDPEPVGSVPEPVQGVEEMPSLSIIVPARNEAQNLRRLLPSLLAQNYPGMMEIIVVDDNSTDKTAAVVKREFENWKLNNEYDKLHTKQWNLRLIHVTDLPHGWLGKPHACHIGAAAACGQWLLFTDADMVHDPASAASAVAFAETNSLHGLSLFPQQETRGVVDSAVLMVAFAGLFAGLRRSTNMLNGQYVLVRRDVYEASGGFSAVCSEMLEDLAFGRLLAEQGYQVPMMRGESLASVCMYKDWRQMWHGVTRLGSGSLRFNGIMAFIPAIFITGVMMPLWTLLFNSQYIREIPRLRLIWFTAVMSFWPWAKRFNVKQKATYKKWETALRMLLAPLAALFVMVSALWGMTSRLLGLGVSWKGRRV